MPSSQRKLDSSRANGALSRGPVSEEGKRTASANALKHGLTAQTVVLQHESEEEYDTELREYLEHFRPASKPELDLVHQIAAVNWRIARYAGVESELLMKSMLDQSDRIEQNYTDVDDQFRLAAAFEALAAGSSALSLLNRYQSRLHHEYQRLLRALQQLQSARQSPRTP
ncbi:MAG TPA: hypothetical protein VMH80_04775 [Bryobacteraceae bacterium]|nr:hypothetical protein [Bryobacteraceae bacterium]